MKSLSKLKVDELKKELAARGLETSGLKATLISRLSKAMNEEEKKNAKEGLVEVKEESMEDKEDDKEEAADDKEEEKEESMEVDADNNENSVESKEEKPEVSKEVKTEKSEATEKAKDETVEEMETQSNDVEKSNAEQGSEEPFDETQLTIIDTYDSNDDHKKRARSPSPNLAFSHLYQRKQREVNAAPTNEEVSNDVVIASGGLDFKNADLNLVIESCGLKAHPLSSGGFEYLFAGARGFYGVNTGKVAFQVKILSQLEVTLPPREEEKAAFRVGFSVPLSSLQLGEVEKSYGYTNAGKKCTKSTFSDYAESFGVDDIITAFLDMDKESDIEISFAKNGKDLGVAFTIPKADLDNQTLFPHFLCKNYTFEVNFGQNPDTLTAFPEKFVDFKPIHNIPEEQKVPQSSGPEKKEDCEVIMMCGLPTSGKTTSALKHKESNPEKLYTLLSIETVLEKMKLNGVERKRGFIGSSESLINKAYQCLDKIIDIAPKQVRNYILDQNNVFPSHQLRRMKLFEGFQRSAMVIVPPNDDFKKRVEKQIKDKGKQHSESIIAQMKANFVFPEEGTVFTTVSYTELPKAEAEELIKTYKEEAKKSNKRRRPSHESDSRSANRQKRFRGGDRNRGGNYRSNNYNNNRQPQRNPRYENVHERQFNRPQPFNNRDRRHIDPWRPNHPNYNVWNTRPAPYQNAYQNSGYRHY